MQRSSWDRGRPARSRKRVGRPRSQAGNHAMTETTKTRSIGLKRHKAKSMARPVKRKVKASKKPVKRPRGRQTTESALAELKRRLLEISDLNFAGAVLNWDQATYMPPGGAAARGRQVALLSKLAHERSTDAALGGLLPHLLPPPQQPPSPSPNSSLPP